MSALLDSNGDSSQCKVDRIQSKIQDFDTVPGPLPGLQTAHVGTPAERRFQCKIYAVCG
jgi:hypothetical protein